MKTVVESFKSYIYKTNSREADFISLPVELK